MTEAAELHDRTRAFMAFYERQAYLVYNLALRVAVTEPAARAAAERAFLALARRADAELQVAPVTVEAALAGAAARPEPGDAGDAEALRLLRATAALEPRQRAALALHDLCGLEAPAIGTALGAGEAAAEELLAAAGAAFAAALGATVEEAAAARGGWLWAPPPQELWERVYPALHEQAEREVRGQTQGPAPAVTSASASGTLRRVIRRGPVVLGLLVAASVGALYGTGTGLGDVGDRIGLGTSERGDAAPGSWASPAPAEQLPAPTPRDPAAPVSAPADDEAGEPRAATARRAKPLSPAELDELRKRELRDLRRLQQRQGDKSLPASERAEAAADVRAIQRVARQRLAAAERRERALRAELRRERARRARSEARERAQAQDRARERARRRAAARDEDKDTAPPADPPETTPKPAPPKEQTPPEQEGGCLYNPDDGTYVCPEG